MMKRYGLVGLFAAAVLAVASTVQAQCTTNCSKARGASFTVQADWAPSTTEPDAADGFRLYQSKDGGAASVVSQLAGSASATTLNFSFTSGLATAGAYTYYIGAFNAVGENPSATILLTILNGKPAKSGPPRIVQWLHGVVTAAGQITRVRR